MAEIVTERLVASDKVILVNENCNSRTAVDNCRRRGLCSCLLAVFETSESSVAPVTFNRLIRLHFRH